MIDATELKNIRKALSKATYPSMAEEELESYFDQYKGSKLAGGGYASVCVPKDREYVIKIVQKGDNDSYKSYARYAMKYHTTNPMLPKVYAMFTNRWLEFYVVEKLEHNKKIANQFTKQYMEYDEDGLVIISKFNPIANLLTTIDKIRRKNPGAGFDIYGSNIMVRSCGTPVITDPLAD